jgi:DNA-binding transcriptional ArsR family regulator
MRPLVHPASEEITLSGVLYALADPVRLEMFRRLADRGEVNCSGCAPIELPKSTLSHHLRVLREAGLVRSEKRGTEIVNAARLADLEARFPGLVGSISRAADRGR